MPNNQIVILTYKTKILLLSKDIYIQGAEKNVWKLTDLKDVRGLLAKDVSITHKNPHLSFIKLTDSIVNNLKRKNGQRLEFYGVSEIAGLNTNIETQNILKNYLDELKMIV